MPRSRAGDRPLGDNQKRQTHKASWGQTSEKIEKISCASHRTGDRPQKKVKRY
ncbi:MAG: hypothetical protein LBQ77_08685 [Treponema sp.]|nr:hypothetical protein [Treponema sp.]